VFLITACSTKKAASTIHNVDVKEAVQKALAGGQEYIEIFFIRLEPVHFPTASDKPLASEKQVLENNTRWLKDNPYTIITLEGHCDERGGKEYNLSLGDRRARNIKTYLIKHGIDHNRIGAVLSLGEEQPKDKGHNRAAWQKNRRCLLYTSPSPRDRQKSRMPSSA
jgi:peptidoglycan-associated lipoprotein